MEKIVKNEMDIKLNNYESVTEEIKKNDLISL